MVVMEQSLRLFPIADISAFVANGSLVAFNVGPDGKLYFWDVETEKLSRQFQLAEDKRGPAPAPGGPKNGEIAALVTYLRGLQ